MKAQQLIPALLFLCALPGKPLGACETALVLAIDVSGSIDAGEYALQVQGLYFALRDPDVADALIGGQVALTVVQWSGAGQQIVALDWRRMLDAALVADFAEAALALPRSLPRSDTAVGQAIAFSAARFAQVRDCRRQVIDISGDGPENAGFTVAGERALAESAGIHINAIAIEDMGASSPVTYFYQRSVITRGGFVVTARGLADYARALQAKLLRELQKPVG